MPEAKLDIANERVLFNDKTFPFHCTEEIEDFRYYRDCDELGKETAVVEVALLLDNRINKLKLRLKFSNATSVNLDISSIYNASFSLFYIHDNKGNGWQKDVRYHVGDYEMYAPFKLYCSDIAVMSSDIL